MICYAQTEQAKNTAGDYAQSVRARLLQLFAVMVFLLSFYVGVARYVRALHVFHTR